MRTGSSPCLLWITILRHVCPKVKVGLSELFAVELGLQPRLGHTSHVMLHEPLLGLAFIQWNMMAIRELLFSLLIDSIKLLLNQILFGIGSLSLVLPDYSFIEIVCVGADISHWFVPKVPTDESGGVLGRVLGLSGYQR